MDLRNPLTSLYCQCLIRLRLLVQLSACLSKAMLNKARSRVLTSRSSQIPKREAYLDFKCSKDCGFHFLRGSDRRKTLKRCAVAADQELSEVPLDSPSQYAG